MSLGFVSGAGLLYEQERLSLALMDMIGHHIKCWSSLELRNKEHH